MNPWPPIPSHTPALMARLDRYVDRSAGPDACWPWTASVNRGGYGQTSLEVQRERFGYIAHRVALWLDGADVPVGSFVLHSCDNPRCCNPKHLRAGTQTDNMRDCSERKRFRDRSGEQNVRARLSREQVQTVRRLVSAGYSQEDLAFLFNVAQTTVSAIKNGRNWGWLQ